MSNEIKPPPDNLTEQQMADWLTEQHFNFVNSKPMQENFNDAKKRATQSAIISATVAKNCAWEYDFVNYWDSIL